MIDFFNSSGDLSGKARGAATYLHTVAIGPMFVDISAQSVGVETVLECIQDISAASTFCPWDYEKDHSN